MLVFQEANFRHCYRPCHLTKRITQSSIAFATEHAVVTAKCVKSDITIGGHVCAQSLDEQLTQLMGAVETTGLHLGA